MKLSEVTLRPDT